MKGNRFLPAVLAGLFGLAGAQSVTIGPGGVSLNTSNTSTGLTFRLDSNGLTVRPNQPAPPQPAPVVTTRAQTVNCAGRNMTVTGSGGRVNLLGRCPRVTVSGSGNTVSIEQAGKIAVRGNGNTVTWRKTLNGSRPTLILSGSGNRVSSSGYVAAAPVRPAPVRTAPAPVRTVAPVAPKTTTTKPAQTAQPLY